MHLLPRVKRGDRETLEETDRRSRVFESWPSKAVTLALSELIPLRGSWGLRVLVQR
jgi:hypothetical protein